MRHNLMPRSVRPYGAVAAKSMPQTALEAGDFPWLPAIERPLPGMNLRDVAVFRNLEGKPVHACT